MHFGAAPVPPVHAGREEQVVNAIAVEIAYAVFPICVDAEHIAASLNWTGDVIAKKAGVSVLGNRVALRVCENIGGHERADNGISAHFDRITHRVLEGV